MLRPGICNPRGTSQPPGNCQVTSLPPQRPAALQTRRLLQPRPRHPGHGRGSCPRGVPWGQHNTPAVPESPGTICIPGGSRPDRRAGSRLGAAQKPTDKTSARRGQSWGGPTASASLTRSRSHPCKGGTAQTRPRCCPGAAVNTSKREKSVGNGQSSAHVQPCPAPERRSLRAAEPWAARGRCRQSLLRGSSPATASRSPDANLPKPTFCRGCAGGGRAGPQTPAPLPADAAWPGPAAGPVGAVTLPARLQAAPRPCAEMGSCIKRPWPEIRGKARQLIINSGASPEEWKSIPHRSEVVQDVEASTVPGSSRVT